MRTFDTTDLNTIIGTGIQFPVQLSTEPSKLLKTEEGLDVIKQSIFIILSTRLGSRYNNPLFGCVDGETLIPIINGTTVPIKDLVDKPCWVYGCTTEGKIVPVYSSGAKFSGYKKVIKLTFDNNKELICTEDHMVMLKTGEYIEAKKLQPNISIMPLYRSYNKNGYELVFLNDTKKWKATHRLLDHLDPKGDYHVHHCNFNKRDNTPENLKVMTVKEHKQLHSENAKRLWKEGRIPNNLKILWAIPEYREKLLLSSIKNLEKLNSDYKTSPELKTSWDAKKFKGHQEYLIKTKEERYDKKQQKIAKHKQEVLARRSATMEKWRTQAKENFKTWHNSEESREHITKLGKNRTKDVSKDAILAYSLSLDICTNREDVINKVCDHFNISRSLLKRRIPLSQLAPQVSKGNKWHNHKIIKIDYLNTEIPVYDLVGTETHNFAVDSGIFIHNSNIYKAVFEPNDAILKDLVYLYTVSALTKWEKRISITRVQFIKNTTDDHFLGIKIHFIVRNTHQAGSYVFPFSATGQPMSTLLV